MGKFDKRIAALTETDKTKMEFPTPQEIDEAIEKLSAEIGLPLTGDCLDCEAHTFALLRWKRAVHDGFNEPRPHDPQCWKTHKE